jgi:hypothetical protein
LGYLRGAGLCRDAKGGAQLRQKSAGVTNVVASGAKQSRGKGACFDNPTLANAEGTAAYVDRDWQPKPIRERYDWLFAYDAINTPL